MYGTTKHCCILNKQALGLVVLEKIFSCYKPLADNDAPSAWPIWTEGAWLAGFIKGITKHCYTQNIKALGLMVSEKIFLCFSFCCKPMGANDPRGVINLDSRGIIGRIYVGYH